MAVKNFVKKHWFVIAIVFVIILRFLYSFQIPSYRIYGMQYDDELMSRQAASMSRGEYLGEYNYATLVKGPVYPFLLVISHALSLNYSSFFTILFILAAFYFMLSLKKIIPSKKILFAVFVLLLFNPLTYSGDLFQRLYRNSISITELLFLFGAIIRIITAEKYTKNAIINYVVLGLILSFMFLTREDNIWIYPVLALLIIYKLYKNLKLKPALINLIPLGILIFSLNLVSCINLISYGAYTYNELKNSNFKKAYINFLSIKDDEHKDRVAIPKSTFYKVIDNSDILGFDRKFVDKMYESLADETGEIDNGNIVWYFRQWIYTAQKFKNGKEANDYFGRLNDELNRLFAEKKLEKELIIPSVFVNTPTWNNILAIPGSLVDAVVYTTTYKNVKTVEEFAPSKKVKGLMYSRAEKTYTFIYSDYRHTDAMTDENPAKYGIIKFFHVIFTVVGSVVALIIYFMNIKKLDKLGILINMVLLSYLVILGGVVYTHVTAYHAIRYMYLGNVYILQEIFIVLNLYRWHLKRNAHDLSDNSSIQRRRSNRRNNQGNQKSPKKREA